MKLDAGTPCWTVNAASEVVSCSVVLAGTADVYTDRAEAIAAARAKLLADATALDADAAERRRRAGLLTP